MNKDKHLRLTRYLTDLRNRLTSGIPLKHTNRPEQYKAFLTKEIKQTEAKISDLLIGAK